MSYSQEQVASFQSRGRVGLLGSTRIDFHLGCLPADERPSLTKEYWLRWRERHHIIRRGMFLDLERERLLNAPEPPALSLPSREPPIDLVQLKGQVNFLQNKVAEMRADKKKRDDGPVPF